MMPPGNWNRLTFLNGWRLIQDSQKVYNFYQKFVWQMRKIQIISEALRHALLTRIDMCIHLVITIY